MIFATSLIANNIGFPDSKELKVKYILTKTACNRSCQTNSSLAAAISKYFTTCTCLITFTKTKFTRSSYFGWIIGRFHKKKPPR